MKEHPNPFAAPGTVSRRAGIKRALRITAGTLGVIAVGVAAWVAVQQQVRRFELIQSDLGKSRALATRTQTEVTNLAAKLASSEASISNLQARLDASLASVSELKEKLGGSQLRVTELEREKESAVQKHIGLEAEMRAELESKDVTISQLQGKLTVNILDRILFDSGEAVLKSGGQDVLEKIAGILAQHPTLKIHVIGHTDNVPIRPGARNRITSNWELSTARALAAVRFLTETAGVDPRRIGAVGYGEFRPVADNSTPEGRGRNRRIAVTILADELAGADTVSTVSTNLPVLPAAVSREPDTPTSSAE
jgi:chemotaxis protein MotB